MEAEPLQHEYYEIEAKIWMGYLFGYRKITLAIQRGHLHFLKKYLGVVNRTKDSVALPDLRFDPKPNSQKNVEFLVPGNNYWVKFYTPEDKQLFI